MKSNEFILLVTKFKWIFQTCTPIDTGNLRYNAVRSKYENGRKTYKIVLDNAIAPYITFTNKRWISPKWNGAKNPNEGWIEKAVETAINSVFQGAEIRKYGRIVQQLNIFTSATRYKPRTESVKLKTFKAKYMKQKPRKKRG